MVTFGSERKKILDSVCQILPTCVTNKTAKEIRSQLGVLKPLEQRSTYFTRWDVVHFTLVHITLGKYDSGHCENCLFS